jgi:hypothetical protein
VPAYDDWERTAGLLFKLFKTVTAAFATVSIQVTKLIQLISPRFMRMNQEQH